MMAKEMETSTLWRGSELDQAQLIWDGRRGESTGRWICSSEVQQICLRHGISIAAATSAGAFKTGRLRFITLDPSNPVRYQDFVWIGEENGG